MKSCYLGHTLNMQKLLNNTMVTCPRFILISGLLLLLLSDQQDKYNVNIHNRNAIHFIQTWLMGGPILLQCLLLMQLIWSFLIVMEMFSAPRINVHLDSYLWWRDCQCQWLRQSIATIITAPYQPCLHPNNWNLCCPPPPPPPPCPKDMSYL